MRHINAAGCFLCCGKGRRVGFIDDIQQELSMRFQENKKLDLQVFKQTRCSEPHENPAYHETLNRIVHYTRLFLLGENPFRFHHAA